MLCRYYKKPDDFGCCAVIVCIFCDFPWSAQCKRIDYFNIQTLYCFHLLHSPFYLTFSQIRTHKITPQTHTYRHMYATDILMYITHIIYRCTDEFPNISNKKMVKGNLGGWWANFRIRCML